MTETESRPASPLPAELLKLLHAWGVALEEYEHDPVLRGWGKHLLEDWRSLDLLAQRYEDRSSV